MARKVFISFLGTNNYVECCYSNDENYPVRFIQEALIRETCKDWTANDHIYIFCTTDAEARNWFDNGQDRVSEDIEKIGLESRLNGLKLSVPFEKIWIPEGFSEDDIWTIFDTVYENLLKDDEIYFDVTHAFRSIPLFSTVLFNYSRFMKETNVVSIKYGAFEKLGSAFEVKKKPLKERGIAPIVDLTGIVQLQTLTRVADDFKMYGKTSGVSGIFESGNGSAQFKRFVVSLKNGTSKLEEYILLNRVEQIRKGDFVNTISSDIRNIRKAVHLTRPQEHVMAEMEKSLSAFSVDGGDRNIIAAIDWALNFNMIQQAYTLAQEYLISLATEKYMDKCFYSEAVDSKKWRNYMSAIMGVDAKIVKEKSFAQELAENIDLTEYFFSLPEIAEIRKLYSVIASNRNILSHGKKSDLTLAQFKRQLQDNFEKCMNLLSSSKIDSSCS